MSKDIAFIHTTSLVIEPVKGALEKIESSDRFFHMLDEALLRRMMNDGNTPELTVPWLEKLVKNSVRGGADGVIVSCSSLSMSVNSVRKLVDVPVMAIDTALYRYVLENCRNPMVLMTNPTNTSSTAYMQEQMGSQMPVELCPGAFEALKEGDSVGHDYQVIAEIEKQLKRHDGILLSQISMERVRSLLPTHLSEKVYSSLDFIDRTIGDMNL